MKTFIWSVPIRIFHWLLVIGFATAYILGDQVITANWHFAFGAFVVSPAVSQDNLRFNRT